MKSSELVVIPAPIIGHLVSTIGIAKRLIYHDDRLSVMILCTKFPLTPFADAYVKSLVGSKTRIKLIHLPHVHPPRRELLLKSGEHYLYVYIESLVPHVRNTLKNIVSSHSNSQSTRVSGLVLDFFCMPMLVVGNELGLPSYMFMTCNLGFLSLMLHLPTHHDLIGTVFKVSDPDVILPGFTNAVPVRVLPSPMFDKDGGYTTFIKLAQRFRETKGILVNSFVELETRDIVNSLHSEGKTPPIYAVGPVVEL